MKGVAKPSTRDRLLAATFRVVARDGLDAASVKAIAAEAGLTSGLLHYHFPTKDALIEEAMRSALLDYEDRQVRFEGLGDFFAAGRAWADADRDFFRLRLALSVRALNDPNIAALLSELNARARQVTAQALAEGGVVSDRHLALAAILKASFDGIMLAWLSDPDFPIDDVAAFMERASRIWLNDQK